MKAKVQTTTNTLIFCLLYIWELSRVNCLLSYFLDGRRSTPWEWNFSRRSQIYRRWEHLISVLSSISLLFLSSLSVPLFFLHLIIIIMIHQCLHTNMFVHCTYSFRLFNTKYGLWLDYRILDDNRLYVRFLLDLCRYLCTPLIACVQST